MPTPPAASSSVHARRAAQPGAPVFAPAASQRRACPLPPAATLPGSRAAPLPRARPAALGPQHASPRAVRQPLRRSWTRSIRSHPRWTCSRCPGAHLATRSRAHRLAEAPSARPPQSSGPRVRGHAPGPLQASKAGRGCARRPLRTAPLLARHSPKSRVCQVRSPPPRKQPPRTGVAQRPRMAGRRAFPHRQHEGSTGRLLPAPHTRRGRARATQREGGRTSERRNRSQDPSSPIRRWKDLRVRGNPGIALQTPVTEGTARHHVLQPREGLCWGAISGRMRMQEGKRGERGKHFLLDPNVTVLLPCETLRRTMCLNHTDRCCQLRITLFVVTA